MKKIVGKLHKLLISLLYPIARILFRKNTGEE